MPYIKQDARERLQDLDIPTTAGELNYLITKLCSEYVDDFGGINLCYQKLNEVIGVLECAKMEFYRRVAAPYEDEKMKKNGDVYDAG